MHLRQRSQNTGGCDVAVQCKWSVFFSLNNLTKYVQHSAHAHTHTHPALFHASSRGKHPLGTILSLFDVEKQLSLIKELNMKKRWTRRNFKNTRWAESLEIESQCSTKWEKKWLLRSVQGWWRKKAKNTCVLVVYDVYILNRTTQTIANVICFLPHRELFCPSRCHQLHQQHLPFHHIWWNSCWENSGNSGNSGNRCPQAGPQVRQRRADGDRRRWVEGGRFHESFKRFIKWCRYFKDKAACFILISLV